MVASILLVLIDIINILVYLDLWVVNKMNKHIYTGLLYFLSKERLKQFQKFYYDSLKREFFCVSDKVDVSGTTFTAVFVLIYLTNIITNIFYYEKIPIWHFYLIGVPYFLYIMFALTAYRALKELCFYCKYALIQNPIELLIMILFYLEYVPMLFFVITGIIFILAVIVKGQTNKKLRERKQQKKSKVMKQGNFEYEEINIKDQ